MKRFISLALTSAFILGMFGVIVSADIGSVYSETYIAEDFENFNSAMWQSDAGMVEVAPIDIENGNKSYKLNGSKNFQCGTQNPMSIPKKAIFDFDFYFGELTNDYEFFSFLGNDGVASQYFESTGYSMLRYMYNTKTIVINRCGTWTESPSNATEVPKGRTAVTVDVAAWNHIRLAVDMENLTFRVAVNGELLSDSSDTIDFKIPFSRYNCVSVPRIKNVRLQAKENAYYDNICYRELTSDVDISSSCKILNGEQNAPVSALLNFEFTNDILPLSKDDIIMKSGSAKRAISEVVTDGKKLSVRLASKLSYDTEYNLSLAKVMTSDGAYLPADKRTVSFKTKAGAPGKIIEEDFESAVLDTSIWLRAEEAVGIAPADIEAGKNNYSFKLSKVTLDNYNSHLNLSDKAIFEFSLLLENVTTNYPFFSMWGTDSDSNAFETSGHSMLGYDPAANTIGIRAVGNYTGTDVVTGVDGSFFVNDAFVSAKVNDWNRIRVCVDMKELTFRAVVNGELLSSKDGTVDFKIPFSSYNCTSSPIIKKVMIRNAAGSDGIKYLDDIYYAELTEGEESISDIIYNDGTARVTVAKNNYSSIPDKVMFAVASYNGNRLVALKMKNIVLETGAEKEYSVTLDDFNGGTVQKVFLWSMDSGDITPLKPSI